MSKRQNGEDSDDEPSKKKVKQKSYLEEELAKYAKGRGQKKKDKRKDESDVLAALSNFRSKLHSSMPVDDDVIPDFGETATEGKPPAEELGGEDPGIEVDDDVGFLGHALHFVRVSGHCMARSLTIDNHDSPKEMKRKLRRRSGIMRLSTPESAVQKRGRRKELGSNLKASGVEKLASHVGDSVLVIVSAACMQCTRLRLLPAFSSFFVPPISRHAFDVPFLGYCSAEHVPRDMN